MKKLSYIFIFFFFFSCTNNSPEFEIFEVSDFEKSIKLNSEKINIPPNLYHVLQMVLLDSVLVTVDTKADKIFGVYKANNLEFIGSYVKKGKGPSEEISFDAFIQPALNNTFMYRSLQSIKFIKFNLKLLKFETQKEILLPGQLLDLSHPFVLNDSILSGWSVFQESEKEYLCLNLNTKEVSEFGPPYPEIIKDISSKQKASAFSKIITVKPDNNLFASAYDKFKIIRIYSKTGKVLKEIRFKNNNYFSKDILIKNPENINLDKIKLHYQKIKSTNKYIYALYSGKSLSEISNSKKSSFCNEIHVWDWNGNPIAKLILDKNIFSFVVASNNEYIIGAAFDDIDVFYKYKLDSF